MTLGAWLDTWMTLYVLPTDLAENTKKCYNRAVRAVPPELSSRDLHELSPLDLRRWLLQVAREHPRAAQLDRVMLHKALTLAYKAGEASPGLCDPDLLPQVKHKPAKAAVLNYDQLRAYMAAALHTEAAPVLLLCCCGLRRGEAMGARWQDIDTRTGTLSITCQRAGREALPLKTKTSQRTIALPNMLLQYLRSRRQLAGWVCDLSQQRIYTAHRQALREADCPAVTLHGLRHTFATLAVLDGVPIKLVQGALGHANYQITADLYADHLPPVSAVSTRLFA